jgi:hypothetical protein
VCRVGLENRILGLQRRYRVETSSTLRVVGCVFKGLFGLIPYCHHSVLRFGFGVDG